MNTTLIVETALIVAAINPVTDAALKIAAKVSEARAASAARLDRLFPPRQADGTADSAPVPSALQAAADYQPPKDPATRQFVRKDGSNRLLDRLRAEAPAS